MEDREKGSFSGSSSLAQLNGTEYDSHYIWVRFKILFYLLRRFLGCVMLYSWVIKTLNKSQEHIRDFPFNFRCGEVTGYCAGSNQRNDKNSIPSDVSVSKRIPGSPPYLSSLSGVPGSYPPAPFQPIATHRFVQWIDSLFLSDSGNGAKRLGGEVGGDSEKTPFSSFSIWLLFLHIAFPPQLFSDFHPALPCYLNA